MKLKSVSIQQQLRLFLCSVRELFLSVPEIRNPHRVRAFLTSSVLFRVLTLVIVAGSFAWRMQYSLQVAAEAPAFWLGMFVVSVISVINFRLAQRTSSLVRLGYAQLSFDVFLTTCLIAISGSHAALLLYLVIICGGAVAFSAHGAVISAAVSALCYSVLLGWQSSGAALPPQVTDVLSVYASLVSIALVAGYFSRQLEAAGREVERHARNLNDVTEQQRQLFNDISDGIITIDLEERITLINQAARAILGLAAQRGDELRGAAIAEAFTTIAGAAREDVVDSLLKGSKSGEVGLQDTQGRPLHLRYSIRTLLDASDVVQGQILVLSDVSHLRQIEEQLSLHERMAKLLADPTEMANSEYEGMIIGESQVMKRVLALVERVATSDAAVLLTGESGTGKEMIAHAIHSRSSRRRGKFVAINCGAIPENLIESELFGHKKGSFTGAVADSPGLFRVAHGGTIFLDEIGELPIHLQSKLLRVLQDKRIRAVGENSDVEVDVRVIAATNKNLKTEIGKNLFREDLYYRLNVVSVVLPPLRERREDIPLLVRHFIGKSCGPDRALPRVSPEALHALCQYSYPGNIRELENIIERALVLGGQAILPEQLPDEVLRAAQSAKIGESRGDATGEGGVPSALPMNLEAELEKIEREMLLRALEASGGVKKIAAELLGLNFRSLRYRLKKYDLGDTISDEGSDNSDVSSDTTNLSR